MFDSIKKHFAGAKAIGEIGHSAHYLFQQLEGVNQMNNEDAISAVLFLYYYYDLEIITKCDDNNLGFPTKTNVNGDWIPIGNIIGRLSNTFSQLMIKYELQNEFNEILERGSLYNECAEYYKVVKKEAGI